MIAEKSNRIYKIDESLKAKYLSDGFDIKDDDGRILAYGMGKSVSYEKYASVLHENAELKAKIAKIDSEKKIGKNKQGN